jgi:general secretion pathway protein I
MTPRRGRYGASGTATRARGFTLLEMMIAVAILSGALTWLVVGVSRNIKAENHAKLMTTATFLAREKMVDIEDELYEKGFGEFEKEQSGGFDDKGFSRFGWRAIVDKVELPSQEQLQTVLSNAQQAKQTLAGGGAADPAAQAAAASDTSGSNPLSAGASALGSQFGVIKDVLEQAIRRVTIRVTWVEGRTTQQVELMAYYTDIRRVDQAIMIGGAAATGQQPGGGGAGGGGGGGGTPGGGGPR